MDQLGGDTAGQIIAQGQGYRSKESCKKGIESEKKNASDAIFVDSG
jgi:uncharacterized protein YegP (UPF0339 family)